MEAESYFNKGDEIFTQNDMNRGQFLYEYAKSKKDKNCIDESIELSQDSLKIFKYVGIGLWAVISEKELQSIMD
ncbi:MAG: hypothetical protein R6U61_06205 [Thermoplasmata archaeon]